MANTYLTRNMTTQGSSIKGTFSAWIKNSQGGNYDCGFLSHYYSGSYFFDIVQQDGSIELADYFGSSGYLMRKRTTAKFRDPNGWFHLYVAIDRSLGTAEDRNKLYINGNRVTDFNSAENFNYSQQTSGSHTGNMAMNNNYNARVGIRYSGHTLNGSMSHVYWIDGSVIDIAQFGSTDSTTGEWKINTSPTIASYGTNGFSILKDGNTITDQSGGSYDFTSNGAGVTKTEDCPSNVFATLNPLLTHAAHGYSLTYGLGNNKITFNEPSTWTYITSTTAGINGKFYAEFKIDAVGNEASIGVIASDTVNNNQTSGGLDDYLGKETDSIGYLNDGRTFKNNSAQQTGLTAISAGNILGVALDTENNTCQFYINGSSSGNAVSLTADKFYHFGVSGYNGTQISCNFGNGYFGTTAVSSAGTNASGNGIFEYDVPTGYTALSTKGLNL